MLAKFNKTKLNNYRTFFSIIPQYKQGIRLSFGKYSSDIMPGFRLNIPFYHTIYTLDIREKIHTIPRMQVISSDNVTFKVDASVQYRVIDSKKAILKVVGIADTLVELCKMELRNKLSSMTINDILQKKAEISKAVLDSMTKITSDWGVQVFTVQIKDMEFDESMKKAMSTVAEATRQAEAKIINATSDIETAKQYNEAAKIYSENPMTVRLREFQLWNSVSKNAATTIYVVPSNLLDFVDKVNRS